MAGLNLVGDAMNHLGVSLYQVLAKTDGNVFFSPASISVAMAMLFRGAKGSTAEEMKQALGYDSVKLTNKEVHKQCHKMLKILNQSKDSYTLTMANSLAHQNNFKIARDFKLDLEKLYQALVIEVDFNKDSDSAVKKINEWVKTRTRNMIPTVIDSLDLTSFILLLNAVYFKGKWVHQFYPENTLPLPFHNNGKELNTIIIPMMFQQERLLCVERKNFKAVELPYKGDDIAMLILLPNDLDGISQLEKDISPDFVMSLSKDLKPMKVNLTLPKLHVYYSKQLKDVFVEIGLNCIFDSGCDLGGISEGKSLMVSDIIHKAVLDVDEEGTKAVAVTRINTEICGVRGPMTDFNANHPFIFAIYDKRYGGILFMGRIIAF